MNHSGQNIEYNLIYKRFEKIVAALYLVTKHLSDTDPLKKNIRQKSVELLESINDMREESYATNFIAKDRAESASKYIGSLLNVSAQAGVISSTNVDIIDTEFTKAINLFGQTALTNGEDGEIDARSYGINHSTKSNIGIGERAFSNVSNERGFSIKDKDINIIGQNKTHGIKRNNETERNLSDTKVSLKPRKKSRREFILSVISQKGEVTIKDISSVFKGCSEKTIQRELISLVNDGVVLKEGERRWSKYSLSRP